MFGSSPLNASWAPTVAGVSVAYPFGELADAVVINDMIADVEVVAIWQPGAFSALDAASIDSSRDVGMAALFARRVGDDTLTFRLEDEAIVDEETGSRWNIFGSAIAGELAGTQLEAINAFPHFWFAWAAFYPDTAISTVTKRPLRKPARATSSTRSWATQTRRSP